MNKAYILLVGLLLALGLQAQTVTPTWEVSFDTKSDLDGFTIIDANGDGHMYEGILRGGWSWLSHEEVAGAASYYYDRNNAADDWLITPGINLRAGRTYIVSLDANAANIYPERFEVYFGNAATVEGMATELIPPTVVNKGDFEHFCAEFSVPEAGVYYVGIHAISDKGQYILDIKNLKVEAGLLANAPAGVTNFTLTADPAGLKKTTANFTLPTVQNDGNPLTEITKVDVMRNGVTVKTFDNVQPGEEVSFTEVVPAEGLYTYSVVAYNENGDGAPVVKKVFVGYDAPTPPVNPHVADKFTSIDLVWEQSLGQNGGLIKRSDMTYYIYSIDDEGNIGSRLATVEKGKLLYNIPMNTQEGEQHLISYAMIAGNSQGLSERVETKGFLVGKSLDYPFAEHFANQGIDHFWWVSGRGLGFDNQYAGFTTAKSSVDGDNGSLLFEGFFDDDVVTLHSAKVSLEGAQHPWLTFSHKAMKGTEVDMSVIVVRPDGSCDSLRTVNYMEQGYDQWKRELVDLSAYQNEKYITLEFMYSNHSNEKATIAYLDNIAIGEMPDYDVTVSVECPETVVAGQFLSYKVTITNNGTKPISNYHAVEVCRFEDGTGSGKNILVEEPLMPMQSYYLYGGPIIDHGIDGQKIEVEGSIVLPDGITENNTTDNEAHATVTILACEYPQAANLNAETSDDFASVMLSWDAPENPAVKATDTFESYAPFISDGIGDWTTIDEDGGISEQLFMGYTTGLEDKAYGFATFNLSTLNPGLLDTNESFAARSGEQCLAAFFCHDGFFNYRNQDNWLISPRLSGKSQKVSLYAANYDISAPEVFEIMYSMTDDNPESFIRIGAERRVADGQWHPFTATLPAGAQYFAIHHYTDADNAYMLRLDDISFIKSLEIDHYNIYHNGPLIGSTADCVFVDNNPTSLQTASKAEYMVSVVYADGTESAPVKASVVNGIEKVSTTSDDDAVYNIAGQRLNNANSVRRGNIIILNGKKYIK